MSQDHYTNSNFKITEFISNNQIGVYLINYGKTIGKVEATLVRGVDFYDSYWFITKIEIKSKYRRLRLGSKLLRLGCRLIRASSPLDICVYATGEMTSKFLMKNGFTKQIYLGYADQLIFKYTKWGIEEMSELKFRWFDNKWFVYGIAELLQNTVGQEVTLKTNRGKDKTVRITGLIGSIVCPHTGHLCYLATYDDPNKIGESFQGSGQP